MSSPPVSNPIHSVPTLYFHTPDGARLAYKLFPGPPTGVPLIAIRGLGGIKEDWLGAPFELARERSVAVMDLRGIGESDAPGGKRVAWRDECLDILELARHLGWRAFDLAGLSMGGMIAQTVALMLNVSYAGTEVAWTAAGYRLNALVLLGTSAAVGTTPPGSTASPTALADKTAREQAKLQAALGAAGGDAAAAARANRAYAAEMQRFALTYEWAEKNPREFEECVEHAMWGNRPRSAYNAQLAALADRRPLLPDIPLLWKTPTLIVHGAADNLIDAGHARQMHAAVAGSRLVVLEAVGHKLNWMDGGATVREMRKFLSEHDAGARL